MSQGFTLWGLLGFGFTLAMVLPPTLGNEDGSTEGEEQCGTSTIPRTSKLNNENNLRKKICARLSSENAA